MQHTTMTSGRLATSAAAIALLLAAGLPATPSAAQGSSGDLGEVHWPNQGNRTFEALADLGARVYANDTTPAKVGLQPLESFRLERVNASATRIIVDEAGGRTTSIVQPHQPRDPDDPDNLHVEPGQLRPVVETHLDPTRRARDILTLSGPPGSFDLGNGSAVEKTRALAGLLGFPLDNVADNITTTSFPGLYGGQRGCYEAFTGNCSAEPGVVIDCGSCRLVGFGAPDPDPAEGSILNPDDSSGIALFDGQDRLVASSVSYVFDLDESAVLEPVDARDQAADALRDRGYVVDSKPGRGRST